MIFRKLQNGGAEGVRTPDLLNAIQALYQLSYDPIQSAKNVWTASQLSKPKFPKCSSFGHGTFSFGAGE